MTGKKKPDTDPEIIEGVAVEKPASQAGRRRSAGRGKAASGQAGTRQNTGQDSGQASTGQNAGQNTGQNSEQNSGQAASGTGTPDSTSNDTSNHTSGGAAADFAAGSVPSGRASLPVMLGAAALVLALASIVIQQWMMARQDSRLHAELDPLAAQLATGGDMLARAEAEILVLKTNQDAAMARLAGVEAALPQDPAAALATLSARLDELAANLDARPSGGDASLPSRTSGLTLAQAGLGAVNAMNAANLDGGDAAQWVPVLRELAQAGLDVGDLTRLEALLTPPPPLAARLRAEASALAGTMQQDQADASGWWQATTGRIAGFIRLRRSDETTAAAEDAAENVAEGAVEGAAGVTHGAEGVFMIVVREAPGGIDGLIEIRATIGILIDQLGQFGALHDPNRSRILIDVEAEGLVQAVGEKRKVAFVVAPHLALSTTDEQGAIGLEG